MSDTVQVKWLTELIENLSKTTEDELKRIDDAPMRLNSAGYDDWGMNPEVLKRTLSYTKWLYKDYFRVHTTGIENIPKGRALIIANHSGQLPIDGMLISMALAFEANPSRIARGMVERWFPSLPFISTLFVRCGLMVGDHRNCRELLLNDECVLVFPEGVRGSGKLYSERYKLQRFGTGFVRLALEAHAPIIPVSVVGCEETYPALFNLKPLAKLVGAPYIPVTPTWPLLGPLGAIPLPAKVSLHFGKPLLFDADPDAPDADVENMVDQVKAAIAAGLEQGLDARKGRMFT